ncbi:MAG: hypothetical protein GY851_08285 [bacterium]|nr:hypothetical protein [bacterium]
MCYLKRMCALALLAMAGPAWAANLLGNPGFEKLRGDTPDRWSVYVAPQEGAEGTVEGDPVHAGKYAVRLHIPQPYDKEPANNWSQNVIEDVGGTSLRLSGYIRTHDATEAAIWIQAFRRDPWTLMHMATTSTDTPVYGTRDWERVEMTVDVPKYTDFVVIRCVLLGHGTAWFDDVALEEVGPGDEGQDKAPVDPRALELAPLTDLLDAPGKDDAATSKAGSQAARGLRETRKALEDTHETLRMMNRTASDDASRRGLIETHEALMEANRQLLDMNRLLQERLKQLRDENQRLREDLAESGPRTPRTAPPPLVPHGVIWKDTAP